MKHFFTMLNSRLIFRMLFYSAVLIGAFTSCRKSENPFRNENPPSFYSSDVIDKWITIQLRLMRDATGIPNQAFSRYYAYSGVAAYESLSPDFSSGISITGKLNGLTGLPDMHGAKKYFWPASVNTALASMNRNIFTAASATDKAAIDSLETALNNSFLVIQSQSAIDQSNAFGKSVADAVFNWSETDGYKNASAAYTPPIGPGLWVPTPPAFAPNPVSPYWGNNRPIITGSIDDTQVAAPTAYSEDPNSAFYKMANEVYTASQNLTDDQKAMALFWRDVPGVTSPGHWESILQQVLKKTNSKLDKAALGYALTGICLNDALISCWQTKYQYTLVRPVTYIRNVIGITGWNSFLTTPAHPEYSSAHAVLSAAAAAAFTEVFGDIGSITDHTYDYLGFAPRTFNSFRAIGEDAGNSRLYAGLHYQPSINIGLEQGRKVSANIFSRLRVYSFDK